MTAQFCWLDLITLPTSKHKDSVDLKKKNKTNKIYNFLGSYT